MSGPVPDPAGGRFPGFDAASQWRHWDRSTAGVVLGRLAPPPEIRFFTPGQEACARALFDQLLDQGTGPRVPVVNMVDERLAEESSDGWHHAAMPRDPQAWRDSLEALDEDAMVLHGAGFAQCSRQRQARLLQGIVDTGPGQWHGFPADRVWSMWTRYACTAYYSHPDAWNEIGFAGPAYPRGYKNLGLDAREPFEVKDAAPDQDPVEPPARRTPGP